MIDKDLLYRFEAGLNPAHPERSAVPFTVIGYGEISTVFTVPEDGERAYKRMPLFDSVDAAESYAASFRDYSDLLQKAGIRLPKQETGIIAVPGQPVVLFITQPLLPAEHFCHVRLRNAGETAAQAVVETVSAELARVRAWNDQNASSLELSIDGQLSNWVLTDGEERPLYVDTSTPLYRINGVEQLDPELFLQSAPVALRWILRLFFLKEVMTRYYDLRQVLRDLAANLHKEDRADLIPAVLRSVNNLLPKSPITEKEVQSYYNEDKMIWTAYLGFRRFDRLVTSRLFRRRYHHLLPGRIKR